MKGRRDDVIQAEFAHTACRDLTSPRFLLSVLSETHCMTLAFRQDLQAAARAAGGAGGRTERTTRWIPRHDSQRDKGN